MSQNLPSPDTSRGQSLPAGTQLEEFVIERVLGVGGFGITYLAKDSSLGRQVVIKENLPAQFCWRDTHALTVRPRHTEGEDADNFQYSLESFRKEASTLASLDHPGIVKVLRSFQAHGTAYFVMPFVEGTALDEVIRQRTSQSNPFTEAEIQDLLTKVLDALGYLHERGIYHRDIKPGNLLMTKAGPVLIDFGAARQRLSERSLTVIESAGYTPFEQLQSRGKIGPWSDIYALGATLYKAISGETPAKATDRAFDDPETPLSERTDLRSRYSSRILQSIDKAMSPKASDRFQGAGQWRGAMIARQEMAAPQVSVPQREQLLRPVVPPPLPTLPTPLQEEDDNAEKHNRRKTLLEYSFAIFIAGLFLICILLLLRTPSPTTPPQPSQAIAATAPNTQQMAAPAEVARIAKEQAEAETRAQTQAEMERQRMSALTNTSKDALFTNSLGMKFMPADTPGVLFCIHETRNVDYAAYAASAPGVNEEWRKEAGSGKEQHPVVNVSWEDANAFCQWLSSQEGRAYRLPTDAEWSMAVGGLGAEDANTSPQSKDGKIDGAFPWGGSFPPGAQDGNYDVSDVSDGYAKIGPVMQYRANPFGIHDLGGNVWEWCATAYSPGSDSRVLRGASWLNKAEASLRSSYRYFGGPRFRDGFYGFRCVLVVAGG
jgi:serine/threonine protein kinase